VIQTVSTVVLLTLALLGAAVAPATATDLRSVLTGYALTSWSQKDGLPPGVITALAQDTYGYLWVGTTAGLYRFDGTRFTPWSTLSANALPSQAVTCIRVDREGAVWVGFGEDGGVSRLRDEHADSFGVEQGLPASAVTTLVEDAKGGLWAGTAVGLYFLRNEHWQKYPSDRGLPDQSVFTSTFLDRRQQMYVGTTAGLFRYREIDQRFERVEPLSVDTSEVPRGVAEDPLGTLLVTDQVSGFRRAGMRATPLDQVERGRGRHLLRDRRGNVWVGTAGQGLWRVRFDDQGHVLFTERATALTGLVSDGIAALIEDREGNIWAGLLDGLNRLTPHRVIQVTDIGLVAGVETGRDGTVWVSTVDELIQFSETSPRVPSGRISLEGARLRSMHRDEAGVTWIGSNRGLSRLEGGRVVPVPVTRAAEMPRQIDAVTSDGHGGVWAYDADQGLLHWRHGRFTPAPLPANMAKTSVVSTFTDSTGRAWLGFANGRIGVSDGDTIRLYGEADGAEAGIYQAIYEDRQHVIWLGGTTGLTRFTEGRFHTIGRANGALVNVIALVEDESENLWIGTSAGIIQMPRLESERAFADSSYQAKYKLYDLADGLAGVPVIYSINRRAIRAHDGRVWFVTGRGLTVLDPRELSTTDVVSPLRIEALIANDVRLGPQPRLALPAGTSRLEIQYTALNLASPQKQQFRYRLDGFDANWVDAGTRRQAFYTNLPPRQYRFQVMSRDVDANWTGAATTLQFSIAPAFYQTVWFMIGCVALAVLAIGGAWRLHVGQVRRRFALLIGERARLSREIHDTLLQSLVGVALQFDAMANEPDGGADGRKERFVRMRKQVEEYIREARQSIWDLRSPKLEDRDLVAALREAGERATSDNGVGFLLTVNGLPRRVPLRTEEQLLRIGQEAMVNAVRHAQADRVLVELEFDDSRLTLRVNDDGRGFDPDTVTTNGDGHYGLTSMRERAEHAGGTLTIDSIIGRGTRIEASVPAPPAA